MPRRPDNQLPVRQVIHYPETDGENGQSEYHFAAIAYLREALLWYYRERPVHITTWLPLHYLPNHPHKSISPDVMVVKGVGKELRPSFKIWVEMVRPCTIIEIISRDALELDLEVKPKVYARLGVLEYFLFDPEALNLDPPLQGFRLKGERYVPFKPARDRSLTSKQMGLRLIADGYLLRLVDPQTGSRVLSPEQEADEARLRADEAQRRADALAAEVAWLRQELQRRQRANGPLRKRGPTAPPTTSR